MVAFGGIITAMSFAMSSAGGPILAMSALIGVFSLSMIGLAKAFDMFSNTALKLKDADLSNLGRNIRDLMGSLLIFAGGGIGMGVANIIGTSIMVGQLAAIGKIADEYAQPIGNMANSLSLLADAMAQIRVEAIQLKKIDLSSLELNSIAGELASNRSAIASTGVPIDNNVRVEVDGEVLIKAFTRTVGYNK